MKSSGKSETLSFDSDRGELLVEHLDEHARWKHETLDGRCDVKQTNMKLGRRT